MHSPSYLRTPHLRGGLVTFVAETDVWTAPVEGGRAWRAGMEEGTARHPRISPDGALLAWTCERAGSPEVVLAPADGGAAVQLTYWGDGRTRVIGWTAEAEVLVVSTRGERATRRTWAWAVPVDGGPARRLPYGPVSGVGPGPGGAVLIQTPSMFGEAAYWKRYRGGTAGRLWIDRGGSGDFAPVHASIEGNFECPMWVGDRIAFLSDHDADHEVDSAAGGDIARPGAVRLWSSRPDGSDLRCHSRHTLSVRNATTDGTRVVYQCGGRLWLLPDLAPGTSPAPVEVSLGSPGAARAPFLVSAADALDGFDPDPTGHGSVITVRGSVQWLGSPEGPALELPAEPGSRAREPRVLGDTGKVAYVVVADGHEALEVAEVTAGPGAGTAPHRFGGGRVGRVRELAAAPDGRSLAVATHDGRVLVADAGSGELTELDRSSAGEISDIVFSPDSRWLAWSHPGGNRLRQLRLADLSDGSVIEATPLRFCDRSPAFTPDGLYLAFLSERSFEPFPQAHVLDLAFLAGTRLCLLPLAARTPSPFAPHDPRRAVPTDEVRVDREGLADRAEVFPVEPGDYIDLRAAAGGVLWIRKNPSPDWLSERGTLMRWDFREARVLELRQGVDAYTVSGNGTRVTTRTGNRLTVLPADRAAVGGQETEFDLSRVLTRVDPAEEWSQAFAEDGQLIQDIYARSDMGGRDWGEVLDRYRPLLDGLGCYDDFLDLLWEVHGELGCSHAYVKERPELRGPVRGQGLLGADLVRNPDGGWQVSRIPRGDAAVDGAVSPLRAPGVDVREGDVLTEVGGVLVDPVRGPAPSLAGRAGIPTRLTVRSASGDGPRSVVVLPLHDDKPVRYHTWVSERRDHVSRASAGRLGYLHVPDMMGGGWAQFHRDLRTEFAREGVVLDLRENAGGFLSELVVDMLSRRIIGWRVTREGAALSYPSVAPRGAVVVVTDEFTGSDGDVATVALKTLGIGPVVGNRTWGGVNVMDWNFSLVDGTGLVLPREAYWFEGPGWQVENHGVVPDVEVHRTPGDWADGRDPQLDEAVRVALGLLAARPAASPPAPGW
ncbi:S41 family peptidase [Streptomyces sp. NPDC055886]